MFNFLDILFIAIIFLLAIHGIVAGFIKEFFSKAAVVLGIFISVIFYDDLAVYLNKNIESEFVSKILSFLIIFILVYLVVRLIQHYIGNFFSGDIFTGLDRSLGFFFGAIEGLLIVSVILVILYAQPWFNVGPLVDQSFFHTILKNILSGPVDIVQDFIAKK